MVVFFILLQKKLTILDYEYIPTIMNATLPNHKNSYLSIFAILFFFLTGYLSNAQVGINTITPNSTLEVNVSLGQKVSKVTTTITLDDTHSIVICDNGAVAKTITLPK